MNKLIKRFCMIFFISILMNMQIIANAQEVIKVAFIPDGNFYILDQNGNLSGYNYDYLTKVSQYTGWEYEFVIINEEDINDSYMIARQMLKNGEIDLLGSQSLTEETNKLYEFGENHYAVVRTTLATLANNSKITKNNFFHQETLRTALVYNDEQYNEYFFELMEKYGITPIITYVNTKDDAISLLVEEKVDVIMNTDYSLIHNSLSILESSNPVPIYFVSTKGNKEILEKLDKGIEIIELVNSNTLDNWQEQYFGSTHKGDLILTMDEKAMLKTVDYLTIGLLKDKEPYQFYSADINLDVPKGISSEILEEISKIIGVEFRYVWADDIDEILQKIENKEIDILATLPTDYALAKEMNLNLTDPYISNGAVCIYKKGFDKNFEQIYYHFVSDVIPFYAKDKMTMLTEISSIIKDIENDGNVILFSDPFMAQYYTQKLNAKELEIQSISNVSSNISMGIGKHIDPIIIGLLNHSILHLDAYKVDEIVYDNMILNEGFDLTEFIRKNSRIILSLIAIIVISIVISLYYQAKKFRNLARRDSLTKLYNAGYFHQYAEEQAVKLTNGALILIDIDYFKQVNDNYGHHSGDTIIKTVAQTIKKYFQADMVARLGGDEFVILIERLADIKELEQNFTKILEYLASESMDIPVTLSIGGYIFNSQTNYEKLYHTSDEILYDVKKKGRNGFSFSKKD